MFAAKTEDEFKNWANFLSMSASTNSKGETLPKSRSPKDSGVMKSPTPSSPIDSKSKQSPKFPMEPQDQPRTAAEVNPSDDSALHDDGKKHRNLGRAWSSPESKERAKDDFLKILQKADFTFWEEEEPVPKDERSRSTEAINIESCLLAPSNRKSPNTSPGHSPPSVRRWDMRYNSLPPPRLQIPPKNLENDTKKSPKSTSPSSSPSLRKRMSKRLGSSWDRNSWAGERSPLGPSPKSSRKSAGFSGSLSPADFADSYGLFESRSSARVKEKSKEGAAKDIISLENPVYNYLEFLQSKDDNEKDITAEDADENNVRRRSATVSSPSRDQPPDIKGKQPAEPQEGQVSSGPSKGPNFNRTLSFITRMKEANNKRKRKMRQIPISADDIVRPAKCGFIKLGSRGMASFVKRCYAVLKDDWLYLYKKPSDTCTFDAYDMTSYIVSANVGSLGIRNFKNQKLSISLEHKVTGDVTILTTEVAIDIFEWAEKLQKSSKDQGLVMEGLNLEQGRRPKGKSFISAPVAHDVESTSQSDQWDDQMAELHRHKLIQEAMKENQQLILSTQSVREAPEQFPLAPSQSPGLLRRIDKLETKFDKASEEEEQQNMRAMTILKKRRISTQVKQDTVLKQLEGRKNKKKQQREDEYAMMKKQLDQLTAKMSGINKEIQAQSQEKEQRIKAIKERKALELQVLEQQNHLLRYRRATQEALENIMEKSPVQRQSLLLSTDDSGSDDGSRHSNSDSEMPSDKSRSSSVLSTDSTPGISLQRPSICQGIPGPLVVLQRSSVELQIGSLEEQVEPQSAPLQSQSAPVQSQNAFEQSQDVSEQSHSAPDLSQNASAQSKSASNKGRKGSRSSKSKPRLLPAIPGSPGSSGSSGSGGSRSGNNSLSGAESDGELQIVESKTNPKKERKPSDNSNGTTFRQYRKSEGTPPTEHRNGQLRAPNSDRCSPSTSESGSDSPPQGRNRPLDSPRTGRRLPGLPGDKQLKRGSKDSTSSMEVMTDGSPESVPRSGQNCKMGYDQTDSGTNDYSMNSRVTMEYRDDRVFKNEQSDANGNNLTSASIYLRNKKDNNSRGKARTRPFSENLDLSRLQVPGSKKTVKKRTVSEDVRGLRTEISPDVLRDIEEFEMMARKALWEAGWQIPI